jgi:hypothetical protein
VAVRIGGVPASELTVATNNPAVVTAGMADAATLELTATSAGRAGLRLTHTPTGSVRHVGVRVRNADGSLPGFVDHVALGSVSEDTPADLELWRSFGPAPPTRASTSATSI